MITQGGLSGNENSRIKNNFIRTRLTQCNQMELHKTNFIQANNIRSSLRRNCDIYNRLLLLESDSDESSMSGVISLTFDIVLNDDSWVCILRSFQCKHAASESNQSLIGSWWQTEGSGYFDVLMINAEPFVISWRWRPSKEAHASPRASIDTIICRWTM